MVGIAVVGGIVVGTAVVGGIVVVEVIVVVGGIVVVGAIVVVGGILVQKVREEEKSSDSITMTACPNFGSIVWPTTSQVS